MHREHESGLRKPRGAGSRGLSTRPPALPQPLQRQKQFCFQHFVLTLCLLPASKQFQVLAFSVILPQNSLRLCPGGRGRRRRISFLRSGPSPASGLGSGSCLPPAALSPPAHLSWRKRLGGGEHLTTCWGLRASQSRRAKEEKPPAGTPLPSRPPKTIPDSKGHVPGQSPAWSFVWNLRAQLDCQDCHGRAMGVWGDPPLPNREGMKNRCSRSAGRNRSE